MYSVDVVNEYLDRNGQPHETTWSGIDDFMCKAFKAARDAAHPDMELFYNDFNIDAMSGWQKTKSDAVFNMLKAMKAKGDECPIDGIGFQTHIDLDFGKYIDSVRLNIQRYAEIGIKVHFTEVDIKCRREDGVCIDAVWSSEDLQTQADLYSQLLQVCLEEANCEAFVTWGYTDLYSWLPAPEYGLPFDTDIKPKVSYDSMLSTLNDFPRGHPAARERLTKNFRQ